MERGRVGGDDQTLNGTGGDALEQQYVNMCASVSDGVQVVVQNSQRVESYSELFYASVVINEVFHVRGMIDSGSMACTLSEEKEQKMLNEKVISEDQQLDEQIILVGCGGHQTRPKCVYEMELKVYGLSCVVPVLVVPGQKDDLILGSNVIKFIMQHLKRSDDYWRLVSQNIDQSCSDAAHFLDMMTGLSRWREKETPNKIGTVKLTQAVTLLAKQEHLVFGKLPADAPVSPGSTVAVEPTSSKSMPRNIMVGRIITSMWGDRWVPMKVVNLSDKPVTLRRNCKLADVSPCLATEDFTLFQNTSLVESTPLELLAVTGSGDVKKRLEEAGLKDIDIESCQVSSTSMRNFSQLLLNYHDVFSKHALDCGEAKGFTHRIRLVDERPFRLPYRRVPPAHYQKLRQVLTEMEEQGIIRKSVSEYASPLVMVWKRDGSLRICTDFRWLNARTLKDAHPLPHQSDCLAALGGNTYFSTMDLTSGFYNIPMQEEDKKYTAFTTPLGLHEYNRMPQGLCNSPASFMRMMLSIFGDLNFSSLLCYLDDLLVFAPTEKEALERLEVVFQRLRQHNLKLSQKKCHFLRTSVRFLGHIISGNGVAVDPEKITTPLTYIMTKPKLDACEQRWVAKLAPYTFDIKHIPGGQNVVADALSRDPFAKTVGHRLLNEEYSNLLSQAKGVSEDGIQDTFRLKVQCHKAKPLATPVPASQAVPFTSSLSPEDVQALYESHSNCEVAAETRAVQLVQSVQQFVVPGQNTLPTLSLQELQQHQEQDSTICLITPFVIRQRRPSRREKAKLSSTALILAKQWEKLRFQNGILYRVSKDPLSKHNRLPPINDLSPVVPYRGFRGSSFTQHNAEN
ncbi:hypothetical protein NFI96_024895 [Prochilodus magdalenae]|nr:hypothetical protein NFI96_024895 [Prochilodus magdalenae]